MSRDRKWLHFCNHVTYRNLFLKMQYESCLHKYFYFLKSAQKLEKVLPWYVTWLRSYNHVTEHSYETTSLVYLSFDSIEIVIHSVGDLKARSVGLG